MRTRWLAEPTFGFASTRCRTNTRKKSHFSVVSVLAKHISYAFRCKSIVGKITTDRFIVVTLYRLTNSRRHLKQEHETAYRSLLGVSFSCFLLLSLSPLHLPIGGDFGCCLCAIHEKKISHRTFRTDFAIRSNSLNKLINSPEYFACDFVLNASFGTQHLVCCTQHTNTDKKKSFDF